MMNFTSHPCGKGRPLRHGLLYPGALISLMCMTVCAPSNAATTPVQCSYPSSTMTIQDTAEFECPTGSPPGCLPDQQTGIAAIGPLTACVYADFDPPILLRPDFGTGFTFAGAGSHMPSMGLSPQPVDTNGHIVSAGNVTRSVNTDGTVSFTIPAPDPGTTATTAADGSNTITGNGTTLIADDSGAPLSGVPAFTGVTTTGASTILPSPEVNTNLNNGMLYAANTNGMIAVKVNPITNVPLQPVQPIAAPPALTLTASGGIPPLPCGGAISLLSGPVSMDLNLPVPPTIGIPSLPTINLPAIPSVQFPTIPSVSVKLPSISYGNIINLGTYSAHGSINLPVIQIGPPPSDVANLNISIPNYSMPSFTGNLVAGISTSVNTPDVNSNNPELDMSMGEIEASLSMPSYLITLPSLNIAGQPLVNLDSVYVPPAQGIIALNAPVTKYSTITVNASNINLSTDTSLTTHLQAGGVLSASAVAGTGFKVMSNLSANVSCPNSILNVPKNSLQLVVPPVSATASATFR